MKQGKSLVEEFVVGMLVATNNEELGSSFERRTTCDANESATLIGGELADTLGNIVSDGVCGALQLFLSVREAFGQLTDDLINERNEFKCRLIDIEILEFEVHGHPPGASGGCYRMVVSNRCVALLFRQMCLTAYLAA